MTKIMMLISECSLPAWGKVSGLAFGTPHRFRFTEACPLSLEPCHTNTKEDRPIYILGPPTFLGVVIIAAFPISWMKSEAQEDLHGPVGRR